MFKKSKLEIEEALLQYKTTTWCALTAIFQNPSDTCISQKSTKQIDFLFWVESGAISGQTLVISNITFWKRNFNKLY